MRFNLQSDRQAAIDYLITIGYTREMASKQVFILTNWSKGGNIVIDPDGTISVRNIIRDGQEQNLNWDVLNRVSILDLCIDKTPYWNGR